MATLGWVTIFWIFDFSSALRVLSNYQRLWFFTMRLDWRKLPDKGMRRDSDLIRSVLQHSTTRTGLAAGAVVACR